MSPRSQATTRDDRPEPAISDRGEAVASPPAGTSFVGRHPIVGPLGAGGMGEVLCVRDPDLGREVAAKVVRGGLDSTGRAKFEREAVITGRLEHPGIIPLYEYGRRDGDGAPYFTMRRVSGVDLARILASPDAPTPSELLAVFAKICEAVAYAHDQGVVHRDLKPANVMTGAYGEVYVLDWGLAKTVDARALVPEGLRADHGDLSHDSPLATRDGTILGTPAYMSPEQAEGRIGDVDARSDLYSLGAILYEMLCGHPPYAGATALAVISQILEGPPPPPSARAPERLIPWELEAIVARAMAREPERRYPTALALKSDVEAFLAGRFVRAARYGVIAALRKWTAAHVLAVGVAAAILGTAGAVAFAFEWRARAAQRATQAALETERHVRLAAARERVRRTDPTRHIEAARAVPLNDDPASRVLPPASVLTELAVQADHLQEAGAALSLLYALDPADELVRRAWSAVLCGLGRVAEARLEDGLAQLAYTQAASLGSGDAAELARRAAAAPAARLARRGRAIDQRLEDARSGELAHDLAHLRAVAELASYRDRQTVERLVAVVEDGRRRLVRAAREALCEVANDPEHTLGAAVERWLDPTVTGTFGDDEMARINVAMDGLSRRGGGSGPRVSPFAALAARQRAALVGPEGDLERCLRLACAVLGLLGDARDTVDPLLRLAWADFDELRAAVAGSALAQLAGRSREARNALLSTVGLADPPTNGRFPLESSYWIQVERELRFADRGVDSAERPDDPTSALAWMNRGVADLARGAASRAVEHCNRALAIDPAFAPAYVTRGMARAGLGDLTGAIADYLRALELEPRSAATWTNLGHARFTQGDVDGAIADYERALEIDPRRTATYLNRGWARQHRGDLEAAVADYERALEIDRRYAKAYGNLGLARHQQGNAAAAIAAFDRAIELDPRYALPYLNRGLVRQGQGDAAGALADYTRALELDPRLAMAYVNRGSIRVSAGDLDSALADFDRAVELDSRTWLAHLNRGVVLAKKGRIADAKAAMGRALECAPPAHRAQVENALRGLASR